MPSNKDSHGAVYIIQTFNQNTPIAQRFVFNLGKLYFSYIHDDDFWCYFIANALLILYIYSYIYNSTYIGKIYIYFIILSRLLQVLGFPIHSE